MKSKIITGLIAILFLSYGHAFSQEYFDLSDTKEVNSYYVSGGYEEEIQGIINKAKDYFENIDVKEMSAVVFDVDETSLSNFEFDTIPLPFSNERWNEWVRSGKATAIKPVKELYDYLISHNFHIIFLSGSSGELYESTKSNLINVGYTEFDTLICRDKDQENLTAAKFKSTWRQKLVNRGYLIEGNIGDQWSDMSGGNSGYFVRITNYIYYIK
jgi:acid phosphatase